MKPYSSLSKDLHRELPDVRDPVVRKQRGVHRYVHVLLNLLGELPLPSETPPATPSLAPHVLWRGLLPRRGLRLRVILLARVVQHLLRRARGLLRGAHQGSEPAWSPGTGARLVGVGLLVLALELVLRQRVDVGGHRVHERLRLLGVARLESLRPEVEEPLGGLRELGRAGASEVRLPIVPEYALVLVVVLGRIGRGRWRIVPLPLPQDSVDRGLVLLPAALGRRLVPSVLPRDRKPTLQGLILVVHGHPRRELTLRLARLLVEVVEGPRCARLVARHGDGPPRPGPTVFPF